MTTLGFQFQVETSRTCFSINGKTADERHIYKAIINSTNSPNHFTTKTTDIDTENIEFPRGCRKHDNVIFANGTHIFTWAKMLVSLEVSDISLDYRSKSLRFTIHAPNSIIAENTFVSMCESFFQEACEDQEIDEDYLQIFNINDDSEWVASSVRRYRSLDTIYLPSSIKDVAVTRLEEFIGSRSEYDLYSIPYKFVCLLEGPPGTGKTSLIHALASRFEKNIAMLSITPKMTDATLIQIFSDLPEDAILVIEDIDCLFKGRSNKRDSYNISFSTLLNLLDGMNCTDGNIIFLTTNFKRELESALVRPGRIDLVLSFTPAGESEIRAALAKLAPRHLSEHEKIITQIKNYSFSIAALQKFLFEYRNESTLLRRELLHKFISMISNDSSAAPLALTADVPPAPDATVAPTADASVTPTADASVTPTADASVTSLSPDAQSTRKRRGRPRREIVDI